MNGSTLVKNVEDCIWGRCDWDEYTKQLVTLDLIDESTLLSRIETVRENVSRQIRKGVERHYPHLVEQAAALHSLDLVQASINREMFHLTETSEQLSTRYASLHSKLKHDISALERLYTLRRILSSALRCEQLMRRLGTVNELIKRSEMINEFEDTVAEIPYLKDISWLTELIVVTMPKLISETKQNAAVQLRSSLETLNASMVSSCVRALKNLSCYDTEVNKLLDERVSALDAELLRVGSHPDAASKILPVLCTHLQSVLEQFSLMGTESVTTFCSRFGKTIALRVPENSPVAGRIVQQFCRVVSFLSPVVTQPIIDALRPFRTAMLSQSLNRIFSCIDSAFSDTEQFEAAVSMIVMAVKEERARVEWDKDLTIEMEMNVAKAMELVSQKIEERLSLDDNSLHMGERISHAQFVNYGLVNMAYSLSCEFPSANTPLLRIARQLRNSVMTVAHKSVTMITLSMHNERLGMPSPYVKELCSYLTAFRQHLACFSPFATLDGSLESFIDYVIEQFLLNASLFRPVDSESSKLLASDLQYIKTAGIVPFGVSTPMIYSLSDYCEIFSSEVEAILENEALPFWFACHLLISRSEKELLSPQESAGWTLEEYVLWFSQQTDVDRLQFLSSSLKSYASSVISENATQYVANYPAIMHILKRAAGES